MVTHTAQLKKSWKKLQWILRSLPPNPSDSYSLEFGDKDYNPYILDTELLRLGILVHDMDIETGAISPPANTFFLPRTDFPEISDACKQDWDSLNKVWREAVYETTKPNDKTNVFSDEPGLFALYLVSTFEEYSFEGNKDLVNPFRDLSPSEGGQPSQYGWIYDLEAEERQTNPLEKKFNVLDMVPSSLKYLCRWKLDPGVTVTLLSDGDELLVDHGSHVLASGDVGQCGDDSRPSRDEVTILVHTMLESMLCAWTPIHDAEPCSYNPEFPVSLPFYTKMVLGSTDENRQYSSSRIGQANAVSSVDIMTGSSMLV
ncbi:hypothetical protein PENSUB_6687 [Penicillium subrubescens]|uniref:Uncharacterized protein n=1 Tax=Penicillium subrubescens TaxID=1316194 RepID=A0A1Q5U0F4_9EURO|nr:hypothetical protein PENSUB_6687 [Penicillium subrubescens]